MTIDYKKYPSNWKTEIRPYVLNRSKHRCEFCKVKNYTQGYWDKQGKFYSVEYVMELFERTGYDFFDDELKHYLQKDQTVRTPKVILTIAHIDHDVNNNEYSNLKALCQRCHLHHDKDQHRESRYKRKKQLNLFQ